LIVAQKRYNIIYYRDSMKSASRELFDKVSSRLVDEGVEIIIKD